MTHILFNWTTPDYVVLFNNSWGRAISKFDLETYKVKVMSEVKGQGHILYPVSNRCISFSFHINRTNYFWDIAKIMFDLEKTHPNLLTKICQNECFVVIRWVVLTLSRRQANFWERQVIEYISPGLCILCAKHLRFSWNGCDMRGKSCCGGGRGGGRGGGGGNELKT